MIGRFSTSDDAKPCDDALTVKRNGKIYRNDVTTQMWSREDPMKEFYLATKVSGSETKDAEGKFTAIFLFAPRSWHYGFFGSKHNREQFHCFYVFLLTPPKKRGSKMFWTATAKSTSFSMISSKRAHGGHEPTRQHMVVTQAEIDAEIKRRDDREAARKNKRQKQARKVS